MLTPLNNNSTATAHPLGLMSSQIRIALYPEKHDPAVLHLLMEKYRVFQWGCFEMKISSVWRHMHKGNQYLP